MINRTHLTYLARSQAVNLGEMLTTPNAHYRNLIKQRQETGRNEMTNQQIAQLARDKGYHAEINGSRIIISLYLRKVSMMEIESELDIPTEFVWSHAFGVAIYGSDS